MLNITIAVQAMYQDRKLLLIEVDALVDTNDKSKATYVYQSKKRTVTVHTDGAEVRIIET
ncbi:hypothetical protein D3C79_696320 [compost metagenome]